MQYAQRGIGLVEILIAVVVMAIGFLSTATMQILSMQFSQDAYFESQAHFMVGDMVDRMRANVEGVKLGAYDNLTTSASAVNPGCDTNACSPTEIAQQDIYDWSQYLHPENENFVPVLPSDDNADAIGNVSRLATGQYTVSVSWANEHDSANGAETISVVITTET